MSKSGVVNNLFSTLLHVKTEDRNTVFQVRPGLFQTHAHVYTATVPCTTTNNSPKGEKGTKMNGRRFSSTLNRIIKKTLDKKRTPQLTQSADLTQDDAQRDRQQDTPTKVPAECIGPVLTLKLKVSQDHM